MNPYIQYLKYLLKHKWFVAVAGRRIGVSWWRLLKHDWTKFLSSEWFPYARYFYGKAPEENPRLTAARAAFPNVFAPHNRGVAQWIRNEEASFNVAWLQHQNRNDHHWQYWILANDDGSMVAIPMTAAAIREMVADWAGAGRAITGQWEVAEWYAKNRYSMQIHPISRLFVEYYLEKLK